MEKRRKRNNDVSLLRKKEQEGKKGKGHFLTIPSEECAKEGKKEGRLFSNISLSRWREARRGRKKERKIWGGYQL